VERTCREWWQGRPKQQLELLGLLLPSSLEDLDRLLQSRKAELQQRLDDAEVIIAEYPREDHQEVAERAIGRRRPFDSKGKDGYRDTLVWLSVLALCRQGDVPIALITNDGDFLDSGGLRIHPDLAEDLKREGLSPDSVAVFRNHVQFSQEHVDQHLQILSDIETQLKNGTYPSIFGSGSRAALFTQLQDSLEVFSPPSMLRAFQFS